MEVVLIDNNVKNTEIYNHLNDDTLKYFFDYKTQSFLHNIDNFYYSIKLKNDLTKDTKDNKVLFFRRECEKLKKALNESYDLIPVNVPGCNAMYFTSGRFERFYTIHVEMPDMFDVYLAPIVPPASDGTESITPEVLVQLRSYNIWMYGLFKAFEDSYARVKKLLLHFKLSVKKIIENRCDFCCHTNYLQNPNKFFSVDNFYKMRVTHFRGSFHHFSNVGSSDYESDYIAQGKRGGKCFLRIYKKTKEVVQKGYKQYFFKAWLFKGLINRYDFYCLESAFDYGMWNYVYIARLKFFQEHAGKTVFDKAINDALLFWDKYRKLNDNIIELANLLTPPIHIIINVEYQVMRKMSKQFPLQDANLLQGVNVDFSKYTNLCSLECEDVFVYFKNLKLIRDYLTSDVFRLVTKKGDVNKSRRDNCRFWERLCAAKSDYDLFNTDERKIIREYQTQHSIIRMKRDVLQKQAQLNNYLGRYNTNPLEDALTALVIMNDNDIHDIKKYKKKKAKEMSNEHFSSLNQDSYVKNNISLINNDTGEIYDYNNTLNNNLQDDNLDWSDEDENL